VGASAAASGARAEWLISTMGTTGCSRSVAVSIPASPMQGHCMNHILGGQLIQQKQPLSMFLQLLEFTELISTSTK